MSLLEPKFDRQQRHLMQIVLFWTGVILALWMNSPPSALLMGLLLGLTVGHPYRVRNGKLIKQLLQASVVGLGFGMNLDKVIAAGQQGLLITAAGIAITLLVGFGMGKLLKLGSKTSHLISSGTAICGGSAIAAVGPILNANEEEMSVALGTVFILNAIALLIFPAIGQWAHLSQTQFGWWAAIAIHDTSSVVGAAAKYGTEALSIATTVKLARALWIVPLAFLTAILFKSHSARITIPWFIGFFLLASVLQTYVAPVAAIAPALFALSKLGLTLTLFLIGAGISMTALKQVGIRPMLQGILLWIFVGVSSFYLITATIK